MGIHSLSRRRFMKTGLVCLAGSAAEGQILRAKASQSRTQAVSRTSLKKLLSISTSCQQCPSGCGIYAHLDGDRCVQLSGNPAHPVNRGSICAKGLAGLNLVYDPDRILFPMKRSGQRGAGKWTLITWDEAYHLLLSHLGRPPLKGRYPGTVFDVGQQNPLLNRFMESLGNLRVIDRYRLKQTNVGTAWKMMTGSEQLIPDISRSRTVLNFGANPFAHHDLFMGFARRLSDAIVDRGARLYTFDVRMSETAAKSAAWFPVRPGTDAAVALSMAHVILVKNLADREFLNRMTDISAEQLESRLSAFTPEKAEEISGISADRIRETAVVFATQQPSVALAGGGVSNHKNGVQAVCCVLLLNWLVGNLEQPGGLFFPSRLLQDNWALPQESTPMHQPLGTNDLVISNSEIDFYFSLFSNPAFDEVNCENIQRYLLQEDRVHFLAVMDTHLTETASLADLVLPAATPLECWGLEVKPAFDQKTVLNLRQPVVSLMSPTRSLRSPNFGEGKITEHSFLPRGEAKDVGNVCIDLARRMGQPVSMGLAFKNVEEYLSFEVSKIPGLVGEGGIQILKKDGFRLIETEEGPNQSKRRTDRPEPISIAGAFQEKAALSIPSIFEDIGTPGEKNGDELVLTPFKSGLINNKTANSKWLREIAHENSLWINRTTAEKHGIRNGDKIQVTSSSGSLNATALVTDRIHPESAALAEGFGHTATGNIAQARKNKTDDRDTNLVWWVEAGKGVNPNRIIGLQKESSSGVFVEKDTLVRIKKIKAEV